MRQSDLKKIISFWGEKKQKIKAVEELSELQKEICKNMNDQHYDPNI